MGKNTKQKVDISLELEEGKNEKIFDVDFFNRLKSMSMHINIRLNGGMGGGRKSNAKGTSAEFSDFREYILGDDTRRIDWNAYGRLDKLFIKLFMEEKEGIFNIFLDCSKSMDFGKAPKSILSLQIAGALSYIIMNNLDRVIMNEIHDDKLTSTKGMTGSNAFKDVLHHLLSVQFYGSTNLNEAIKSKQLNTKGVSVIISDFLDEHGILEAVKYLAYKKQEIILIQVLAQEEIDPELDGTVQLIDSETNEMIKLTLTPQVIKEYKKALGHLYEELEKISKKYGILYIKATTEHSIDQVLSQYLSKINSIY